MLFVQLDARLLPATIGGVVVAIFCELVGGGLGATDVDEIFGIDEVMEESANCKVDDPEEEGGKEVEKPLEVGSDEAVLIFKDDARMDNVDVLNDVDALRDVDEVEDIHELENDEVLTEVAVLGNVHVLEDEADEIDKMSLLVDAAEVEKVNGKGDDDNSVDELTEAGSVDEADASEPMALGVLN